VKTWVISGPFLELADGESRRAVTADEVYRAVVENDSPWPDLVAGQNGATEGLTFSPYPADLHAVVADAPQPGLPVVSLTLRTQDGQDLPVPIESLRRGHVVARQTWYPLSPDTLDELGRLLSRPAVTEDGRVTSLRGLLDLKAASAAGSVVTDRTSSGTREAIRLAAGEAGDPEGVIATLYPYQTDGWKWLRFVVREQLGGLLADEMGLGKTLQIISVLSDPGTGSHLTKALVVAPGSLLENWARELKKFAPHLRVLKHQGADRTGRAADLAGYDVVVASYDTVGRDLPMLRMIEWEVVILDEAQNIKNPDAARTKAVKRLNRKVGLAMTGTPVENSLVDLWSILDFAVPGYLGEAGDFRASFTEDVDGAARLEPLVTPLMLRRTVAEVATDLPERIDIPEVLELTDEEANEYERIRQEILKEYGSAGTLVSLTALRQYCAHPGLLNAAALNSSWQFSKFERLKEILHEIALLGEKALVFTSFNDMADLIASHVSGQMGLFSGTLNGDLPTDERQGLIDRFFAVEGSGVMVLNPRAGGAGLNITAANHVIHYNLEWNPALEDQASARAHRRGQTKPVTVRRLYCAGTVEEAVNDRVQRKRSISGVAIVGVEGADDDYQDVVAALARSPLNRG
jgi:SNF2 family DNA or RNA helicase